MFHRAPGSSRLRLVGSDLTRRSRRRVSRGSTSPTQRAAAWVGTSGRSAASRSAGAEALEDRTLLATFTVDTTIDFFFGGALPGSFRAAIFNANATPGFDEIVFETAGDIDLDAGDLTITDTVRIRGNGNSINGNFNGTVLTISEDAGFVEILDLGFFEGNALEHGGAIRNEGNDLLRIGNATFSNNEATLNGGAIFSRGPLVVNNSTFGDGTTINRAGNFGGAIFSDSRLVVSGSTFTGNRATSGGGAIFSRGSETEILGGSEFLSNSTDGDGGAIESQTDVLSIDQTVLTFNRADTGNGGGLFTTSDTATIERSRFDAQVVPFTVDGVTRDGVFGNFAGQSGGAIFLAEGTLSLVNSQIDGANANIRGGGIATETGTELTIESSAFLRNGGPVAYLGDGNVDVGGALALRSTTTIGGTSIFADNATEEFGLGGAIFVEGGSLNITGATFRENVAHIGGGLFVTGGLLDVAGSTLLLNTARLSGGAIALVEGSTATLRLGTALRNNAAFRTTDGDLGYGRGGGLFVADSVASLLSETVLLGNVAGTGGGIAGVDSTILLSNADLISNQALLGNGPFSVGLGGGMHLAGGRLLLREGAIVRNNEAVTGGGIAAVPSGDPAIAATTATVVNVAQESAILANEATGEGGGLSLLGGSENITLKTRLAIAGNSRIALNVAAAGGGVRSDGGRIVGTAVRITANSAAGDGGGLLLSGGLTAIAGGTLADNTAGDRGGAIAFAGQPPVPGLVFPRFAIVLVDGVVALNDAEFGGGLAVQDATNQNRVRVLRTAVTDNIATDTGGGAFVESGALVIGAPGSTTLFARNSARESGGIHSTSPMRLIAVGLRLVGNAATIGPGGGLGLLENATARLIDTVITDNFAATDGGGINHAGSTVDAGLVAVRTTITDNTADDGGGLFVVDDRIARLFDSTVAGNTPNDVAGGGQAFGV